MKLKLIFFSAISGLIITNFLSLLIGPSGLEAQEKLNGTIIKLEENINELKNNFEKLENSINLLATNPDELIKHAHNSGMILSDEILVKIQRDINDELLTPGEVVKNEDLGSDLELVPRIIGFLSFLLLTILGQMSLRNEKSIPKNQGIRIQRASLE